MLLNPMLLWSGSQRDELRWTRRRTFGFDMGQMVVTNFAYSVRSFKSFPIDFSHKNSPENCQVLHTHNKARKKPTTTNWNVRLWKSSPWNCKFGDHWITVIVDVIVNDLFHFASIMFVIEGHFCLISNWEVIEKLLERIRAGKGGKCRIFRGFSWFPVLTSGF